MHPRRRAIIILKLHQHNYLRELVEATAVPDGQFIRRWPWFCELVQTFNDVCETSFSPEQVHHYIMTLRKRPASRPIRWDALGDGCARMPGHSYASLSATEQEHMVSAYVAVAEHQRKGSDAILVNKAARLQLAKEFAARAGIAIDDRSLIAAVIDLRKDGLLPTLSLPPEQPRKRFDDFGEAEKIGG